MKKLDMLIGGVVATATGSSGFNPGVIVIQNPVNADFFYRRIAVRYKPGLETVLISLQDLTFNRSIMAGSVPLSVVGQPNNAAYNRPYFELENWQLVARGMRVLVDVVTVGTVINANDLAVTLVGFYEA